MQQDALKQFIPSNTLSRAVVWNILCLLSYIYTLTYQACPASEMDLVPLSENPTLVHVDKEDKYVTLQAIIRPAFGLALTEELLFTLQTQVLQLHLLAEFLQPR